MSQENQNNGTKPSAETNEEDQPIFPFHRQDTEDLDFQISVDISSAQRLAEVVKISADFLQQAEECLQGHVLPGDSQEAQAAQKAVQRTRVVLQGGKESLAQLYSEIAEETKVLNLRYTSKAEKAKAEALKGNQNAAAEKNNAQNEHPNAKSTKS